MALYSYQVRSSGKLFTYTPADLLPSIKEAMDITFNYTNPMMKAFTPRGTSTRNNLADMYRYRISATNATAPVMQIYNSSKHFSPMEYGRRPAFVPLAPLIKWVKNKVSGISGNKEARAMANKISRIYSQKTSQGFKFFTMGFERIRPTVSEKFGSEVKTRVVEFLNS